MAPLKRGKREGGFALVRSPSGVPGDRTSSGERVVWAPFDNRAGTQQNRGGPRRRGTPRGPPIRDHPAPIAQEQSASLPNSQYGCDSRWALPSPRLRGGATKGKSRAGGCNSRRSVQRPVVKQHHDRLQNGRSRGGTGLACQDSRYRGVADLHAPLSREKYGVSTRRYRPYCQALRVGTEPCL